MVFIVNFYVPKVMPEKDVNFCEKESREKKPNESKNKQNSELEQIIDTDLDSYARYDNRFWCLYKNNANAKWFCKGYSYDSSFQIK